MTPIELFGQVRLELNRPADDDFYANPEIWGALQNAERDIIGEVAMHHPDLLAEEETIVGDATGTTYLLDDYPAHLEIWEPPGRGKAMRIYPKDAGAVRGGYRLNGKTITLDPPRTHSPGIYVYWFGQSGELDEDTDSILPPFMHEYLAVAAAVKLARKPGSRIHYGQLVERATALWEGESMRPSDVGILGRMKRTRANYGVEGLEYDYRGVG